MESAGTRCEETVQALPLESPTLSRGGWWPTEHGLIRRAWKGSPRCLSDAYCQDTYELLNNFEMSIYSAKDKAYELDCI
jgi:hypothetical protein